MTSVQNTNNNDNKKTHTCIFQLDNIQNWKQKRILQSESWINTTVLSLNFFPLFFNLKHVSTSMPAA